MDISVRVEAALEFHRPFLRDAIAVASLTDLEKFEEGFGHRMPESFRYLQVNCCGVELLSRVSPYFGWLWDTPMPYFGRSIESRYDQLKTRYLDDDAPEGWARWLTKMVPIGEHNDDDAICLDFAFDAIDPPVVVIGNERGGPAVYNRPVTFAAAAFLQYLEFEVGAEDGSYETDTNRVTQRMVDWYAHRDAILGSRRRNPPAPTAEHINAVE